MRWVSRAWAPKGTYGPEKSPPQPRRDEGCDPFARNGLGVNFIRQLVAVIINSSTDNAAPGLPAVKLCSGLIFHRGLIPPKLKYTC